MKKHGIALLIALSSIPFASAQDPAEMNVDQMIEQMKGLPGSEAAIAELRRRKGEIEAAQAKARAARQQADKEQQASSMSASAPQDGSGAVTVAAYKKPYRSILEMIPAPPKTCEEAAKRLGTVGDRQGDAGSAKAQSELDQWFASIKGGVQQLGTRYGQFPSTPDEIRAHQAYTSEQSDFLQRASSLLASVGNERNKLDQKHQDRYKNAETPWRAAIKNCSGEGTTPAAAQACKTARERMLKERLAADVALMKDQAATLQEGRKSLAAFVSQEIAALEKLRSSHKKAFSSAAIQSVDLQFQQQLADAIARPVQWNNDMTTRGAQLCKHQ